MMVSSDLRRMRENKRLTQEGLAKLAGVTRQTIISIERGRYMPSLPLALVLAKLFDCRVEDLFRIEEE